jgi:hypothetical protein
MNIWSIRNIFSTHPADTQSAVRRVAKPAPAARQTQPATTAVPCALQSETQCQQEPAATTENLDSNKLGLNDLFDMSEDRIRKLSPTGNFSKLKSPQQ